VHAVCMGADKVNTMGSVHLLFSQVRFIKEIITLLAGKLISQSSDVVIFTKH